MRMTRVLALLALVVCGAPAASAAFGCAATGTPPYAPNWASLDQRPTPQWWRDAKFGIFIHWGVYSVPAFAPVGDYAEWYGSRAGNDQAMIDKDVAHDSSNAQAFKTKAFHDRVYGPAFRYDQFAPMFKAELFDPAQWAQVLKGSGAKYVVLTSKHHDGFALWPSREASATWGHAWNSVDTGPKRDLLGELSTAVRGQGLEMGLYFSLYEWFNPLWLKGNVDAYVTQHMVPQFKDVVTRYQPSVIFSDGEWLATSSQWRSPDLLAWLFNDSKVCGRVVVDDRWGKETRHKHGGYYTTEYGVGLPNDTHAWEENRGIGYSFGLNRAENLSDYASGQRLVLSLVDTVSRGGNLLLDIGPAADGTIPVVMQDRLAHIGNWLNYNSEAIYGTTMFRGGTQWSAGRQPALDYQRDLRSPYDVIKLMVAPDAGMARKEIVFTRKPGVIYALTPVYPGRTLTLRGLDLPARARVTLLGSRTGDLRWTRVRRNIVIEVPAIRPRELGFGDAYVFRIEESPLGETSGPTRPEGKVAS